MQIGPLAMAHQKKTNNEVYIKEKKIIENYREILVQGPI